MDPSPRNSEEGQQQNGRPAREAIVLAEQLSMKERRLLLCVLTQNMHELAANIGKDHKLQEACADLAERSFEYFEWLDHDRELLQSAPARLLVAMEPSNAEPP